MANPDFWLVDGTILTPRGNVRGALGMSGSRLTEVRRTAPSGSRQRNLRGQFVAPGFIDLHIWGDPERVARQETRHGTTGFLTALGPQSPERLVNSLVRLEGLRGSTHARCLGIHLEGPFLNPFRAGALASRWLRPPTSRELRQIVKWADARVKMVTIAPEIPRGLQAIRWLSHHGLIASLGHSDADALMAQRAVAAGARAVTHVYNGMRPLHHRDPGLLGEVLTDERLTAMVILDGVHVDPVAFQLLVRCKGPDGIVLVTDSIRHQGSRPRQAGGAYYLKPGVLAGSRLTMIRAVHNAVVFGKISVAEAVLMASRNPARLLGIESRVGTLEAGKQADIVVFDQRFRVSLTIVNGTIVYQRAS